MTRPIRSDVTTTGSDESNVPVKRAVVTNTNTATRTTRMRAHHAEWSLRSDLDVIALAREVEVAGRTVNGNRHQQHDDAEHDHRSAYSAPHGFTDAGRTARCGKAVVGVDEHRDETDNLRQEERPEQVGGIEERIEVVVVYTARLAVDECREGLRGDVGQQHR